MITAETGLGRDGLERLIQRLAERIDATAPDRRERFLTKAFMLLADRHGHLDSALASLDDAARHGRDE